MLLISQEFDSLNLEREKIIFEKEFIEKERAEL